ncbi:histidine phosphatase family protein [Brevibacillus choshinensis]|uniref:Histidine phosphatase family protein n=1 Tax=Brevibacillus choshinensis TaxID=54911 RepID=A0ABX7FSV7_BRECH|nr:histidine phosphatase family protein [Brevibacillus choshinensis]QRG68813.1 histidine phosphatase family protein [Brevibacillus choshinensis]
MRWLWIRHGETDMNRQKRYLGHSDVALNETGLREAGELAKRLARVGETPVTLYSSDLRRCVQTAEPLAAGWKVPLVTVPALRELSFGDWELFTYEQLMEKDNERATRWYADPFTYAPPNGESLRELGGRVDQWLRGLLKGMDSGEPAGTAVIVTHGGVIRWFQAEWLMQDPSRYWQTEGLKNGEVLVVEWDGQRFRKQSLTNERGS